jgi:protein TonB
VKVVHGLPQLINAAEHAVSQWQFEPARRNGVAIPVGLIVHVHFDFAKEDAVQSLPERTQPTQVTRLSLPPAPVGTLRVSGRVMQQRVVKRVDPVYPAEGIPLDAKGDVLVVVVVSQTGDVQDVEALSGPSMFRQPAIEAIKQWRFTPYMNDGQPASVQTTVTLHFERPK